MTQTAPPDAPVCTLDTSTGGLVHIGAAHAAEESALRLAVNNPTGRPLRCERVTLTLPVGTGPEDLSSDPSTLRLASETEEWQLDRVASDRFELVPSGPAEAVELAAGETRTLLLSGLRPNARPGTSAVRTAVRWATSPGTFSESTKDVFNLVKSEESDLIKDFTASATSVQNGDAVKIRWKGRPKDGRPVYRLYFDNTEIKADDDKYMDKEGNGSYTTPGLTRTTAFMLLVKTKDADYGSTLAVTVREPDLVVGELTSNGVVKLLGEPKTLHSATSATTPYTATHTATTDGLIAGRVECEEDGRPADFTAIVTAPLAPKPASSTSTSHTTTACARVAKSPENVLVPVPKGATVEVSVRAEAGSYTTQLTWFPMGIGDLAERA